MFKSNPLKKTGGSTSKGPGGGSSKDDKESKSDEKESSSTSTSSAEESTPFLDIYTVIDNRIRNFRRGLSKSTDTTEDLPSVSLHNVDSNDSKITPASNDSNLQNSRATSKEQEPIDFRDIEALVNDNDDNESIKSSDSQKTVKSDINRHPGAKKSFTKNPLANRNSIPSSQPTDKKVNSGDLTNIKKEPTVKIETLQIKKTDISKPPKKEWKWWHAWDIHDNCKEMFIRERDTNMNALDGVRALAFMWVLTDHFQEAMIYYVDGLQTWFSTTGGILNLTAHAKGSQGVTSFFVLSGFLIPFILAGMSKKAKEDRLSLKTTIEFLYRRFMRLAPSLWAAVIIAVIYGYFSPLGSIARYTFWELCEENWWTNVIFVSNFTIMGNFGGQTEDCYQSNWSISVEYQLYFLSLIPMYFYLWRREYGHIACIIWIITSAAIRTGLSYYVTENNLSYDGWVYEPSFCRADAYGLGMGTYFLWDSRLKNREKDEAAKKAKEDKEGVKKEEKTFFAEFKDRIINWYAGMTRWQIFWETFFWLFMIFIIIGGFDYLWLIETPDWWPFDDIYYNSWGFFIWAAALSAVIYIALDGHWAVYPLTWMLKWYIWYPIASLAYTGGLFQLMCSHMYGTWLTNFNSDSYEWNGSWFDYFYLYLQAFILTMFFGLCLSLAVERPFMNLSRKWGDLGWMFED